MDADNLARFADSLLFSPTNAGVLGMGLGGIDGQPMSSTNGAAITAAQGTTHPQHQHLSGIPMPGVTADGLAIDFQEIANYFNLPSPLPSLTPPGSTAGGSRGFVFSFDNIPQGPGRINPMVAAAFVNPGRQGRAAGIPVGIPPPPAAPLQGGGGVAALVAVADSEANRKAPPPISTE